MPFILFMTFLEKLLDYLNLTKEDYEYLNKDISSLTLPDSNKLLGMDKAIARIKLAMENKEKIVVYGDYDTDGIMATSILVKAFKYLDYEVGYYIPCRYLDGYGLNKEKITQFKEKGYSLIITVDNGITLVDEVDYANSLGIDVIVSDHHEFGEVLPNAVSIIHPTVSKLGDVIASGAAMAYYISVSLLNRSDDYLLALAAISTISDLMELKEYNRDMVRLGIDILNNNHYLPIELLNVDTKYDEKSIAMRIVPKINAIGRIKEDISINKLVKYFTSEDKYFIREYAKEIEAINEERKELTTTYSENISSNLDLNNDAIIEIFDIKEGMIGLVANKLLGEHNKPALIFTYDNKDKDILKGSIRSRNGFNVKECLDTLNKYLLTGGGHSNAGGLSIKASDFESFKKDYLDFASKNKIVEEEIQALELSLNDITFENEEILRSLSPFGVGFPEPKFIIKDIATKGLSFIKNDTILSTQISYTSKLLGFNMNKSEVTAFNRINIIGTLKINEFKGYRSVIFQIEKYINAL